MAYQEYVQKAIATGKTYDDLPAKVRGAIPLQEWKARVWQLCIQQGSAWDSSQARGVCTELEYYEQLVATYKAWGRLYPYHLAEYVARVLRVTPFRYYADMLFLCLKEERSYDRIPNFTAADALRLTGIGRNEYIALLNTCKSKRLMWRLNKGLARELLPTAPPDVRMAPWWRVAVVNVGESEFRELSADESALLRAAADGSHPLPVSHFDPVLLQQLYRKGLVYLVIPIAHDDRFSIPPLEGFVSNKTSEAGDESVDPFEPLLYRLFLANSSRLDQARLADVLGISLNQLQLATAIAVRLGFATRLQPGSTDDSTAVAAAAAAASTRRIGSSSSVSALLGAPLAGSSSSGAIPDSVLDDCTADAAAAGGGPLQGEKSQGAAAAAAGLWGAQAAAAVSAGGGVVSSGGAVAVVVDAETTSFLMMGALSSGLKRHSVSLFEGGRVSGEGVMQELISELQASAAAAAGLFEGDDMAQLMHVIQSLGVLLACVKAAASQQGHSLELLRQESIAGLDPLAAAKVLSATYTSILPISPLPGHTLPRLLCQQLQQQQQPAEDITTISNTSTSSAAAPAAAAAAAVGPTFFGPPSPEADSPWLQLALYAAARAGPVSLVFVAGCRVWRLPPQLQGCTHALLWGWGPAAAAAAAAAADTCPLLVEGSNLLCTLNELLSRTAVMVQPLVHLEQLPAPAPQATAQGTHLVRFIDVPLPLRTAQQSGTLQTNSAQQEVAGLNPAERTSSGKMLVQQGEAASAPRSAVETPTKQQQADTWDPFGGAAWGANSAQQPTSSSMAPAAKQQQQQLVVQAVERTGAASGRVRDFELPAQVVGALRELHLSCAVGWLRLVCLPPPAAAAAAGPQQQQPWVPLSVNLGVPLFCPSLCQLVCDSMMHQQSLTPDGEAAWRSEQQQLQQQLSEHVDWAHSSSRGSGSCQKLSRGRVVGQGVLAVDRVGLSGAGGMAGGDVTLPSHYLLFDGHSLLPVDVSDCLQGVQLW